MKDHAAPHDSHASRMPRPRGRSIGLGAVLFDMDGTLVETEEYWDVGLAELAVRLGGELSPAVRPAMTGVSVPVALDLLYGDLGIDRAADDVRADDAWLQARVVEMLTEDVVWRPGARELLAGVLAGGVRAALVTTTHRPLVTIVLSHLVADLEGDPFTVTVCGDEVPAVKPDPAPYRQAMTALGVEPAKCVVVEDSLAGVSSGLAAGAAVLGVPALQELPDLPGLTVRDTLVGVTVDDLRALVAGFAAEPVGR